MPHPPTHPHKPSSIPIIPAIDQQEALRWLETRPGLVLLDVLMPERYAQKHLPGSVNACVFEVVFPELIASLIPDRATPVLCYGHDHHTRDALAAADKLLRLGYEQVCILKGGLKAWEAAALPLEGELVGQEDGPDASPSIADGRRALVVEESRIEWIGRNRTGRHLGTVQPLHGLLAVEEGSITGQVVLDMRSLDNLDLQDNSLRAMLLAHLRSEDFFQTDTYPEASYEILSAGFLEDATASSPNYELHGALTLRGKTRSLSVRATLSELPATETAPASLVLEAHFDLDRTRWGAIYGSAQYFKYLGYHLVFDPVSIALRLVFR
ncbi:YceI family protein [Megalodesulfovibrio paquesii]